MVTSFLLCKGRILILRRSESVGTYRGKWAGVSGYVEDSVDKQAFIEIEEETGLSEDDVQLIRKGRPLEVHDQGIGVKWVVHPYLFRVRDPGKIRIDWEHKQAKWIRPEEINRYETVPKLKEVLQRVYERI